MYQLYPEICQRFPEVRSEAFDDCHDLPYVLFGYIVTWLSKKDRSEISPDIIKRVSDFITWCNEQPRGTTADDDLYTAFHVAFLEKLFRHDTTRIFIPLIISKDQLNETKDYFLSWVDLEEFEAALKEYK
jgi:hypothetical protein